MTGRKIADPELARVGDVRQEQGDRFFTHRPGKIDDERRVPGAGQPLGDPLLVPRIGREVRPERRVVQRDLTPEPAYMRDGDPALPPSGGMGLRRERDEVEDAHKNLQREDGDWNEHVATREHGEDQTLRSIDVLVDCGEGGRARLGVLDSELKLVQLALEAG